MRTTTLTRSVAVSSSPPPFFDFGFGGFGESGFGESGFGDAIELEESARRMAVRKSAVWLTLAHLAPLRV